MGPMSLHTSCSAVKQEARRGSPAVLPLPATRATPAACGMSLCVCCRPAPGSETMALSSTNRAEGAGGVERGL